MLAFSLLEPDASFTQTPAVKPVTFGNEQTTVCSAMAIKTCPTLKAV